MRNPLKRLALPELHQASFRERLEAAKSKLSAVREKYGRTLRVHRALNAPAVMPEPVDRVALVNYATWLDFERYRVCAELYPHLGTKATRFTIGLNAAERFFYPEDGRTAKDVPPASSRALKVLDLVGVDWREDTDESDRRRYDDGGRADTGERPAVPFGWPALDAGVTEALDNLERLDAALNAFHAAGNDQRNGDEAPGYEDLADTRLEVLTWLAAQRAKGLPGLQAKAHAILSRSISEADEHVAMIAGSLARDLIGAQPSVLDQHRPDPIFAAIEDVKRAEAAADAGEAAVPAGQAVSPEYGAAVWDRLRDELLKTVPTTAAGCQALAAFVPGFFERWGASMEADAPTVFRLIARSPLRT